VLVFREELRHIESNPIIDTLQAAGGLIISVREIVGDPILKRLGL